MILKKSEIMFVSEFEIIFVVYIIIFLIIPYKFMLQNYVYLQKRGNVEISQKIATMEIQKFAQKKNNKILHKKVLWQKLNS